MKALFVLMVSCFLVPLTPELLGEGTPSLNETYLSGHITEDTIFPSGIYIVTGNIIVEGGVRVEFRAGADVRFSNTNHGFYVYGALILNGTPQNPVYFRHENLEPTPGGYKGIIFMRGASGLISYAVITDAETGVTVRGVGSPPYVEVRDSEIAYCNDAGVKIDVAHLVPSPSFPHQNRIIDTTIRNCTVGIKNNGIGTLVESCNLRYNSEYGIYLGHDPVYPVAPSTTIRGNTFSRNGEKYQNPHYYYAVDLYINGTAADPEDFKDILVYDNDFYHFSTGKSIDAKGTVKNFTLERNYFRGFYPDHTSPVNIEYVEGGLIASNTFGNGSGIGISYFRDLTIDNNYFIGISGLSVGNGENLLFSHNTYDKTRFYENSGEDYALFKFWNVTSVEVTGNAVYNFTSTYRFSSTAFYVIHSAPVLFYNNTLRGCKDNGISIVFSVSQEVLGEVILVNNTVDCEGVGLGLSGNEVTHVKGLKVFNCSTGIWIELDSFYGLEYESEDILIEDSDLLGARHALELDRLSYSGDTRTVYLRNTTYNTTSIIGRAYDVAVVVTQYLKVRAYDDLLRPTDAHLRVRNASGTKVFEGEISGASPIIEGPPLRYYFDMNSYWRYPVVNFTDVNLIYELEGRAIVQGTLNLTRYTELNVLLDGPPVYQGPPSVGFMEDYYLLLDPYSWFVDLDPIECEILSHDSNLTVDGFNITNTVENWYGTGWVVIDATDSWENSTQVNLTVNVYPVQDPPEILPPLEDVYMDEDTGWTLNLSGHMYDPDGDPLTWRFEGGENLSLSLDPGTWELTITPAKDFFGESVMRLYLSDGEREASQEVSVHVRPVNDPPVFTPPEDWNITVEKGVECPVNLSGYVSDVDSHEFTFVAESDYAAVVGGVLIIQVPTTLTTTMFNVRIIVYDQEGANDSAVLTVLVVSHWNILSAVVSVDEDGNWNVEVRGESGLTVYIVVEGDGSFPLTEVEEGVYRAVIPGEEFEGGKTYSYHFSDREGGEDMAPHLSSSVKQPEKKEEKAPSKPSYLYILLLVVIILIVGGIFLLKGRRKGGTIEGEE